MTTLRLATYNLRDLLDDVGAVARVLRLLDADVVCVQEVPRSLRGDLRTVGLAARTGYRTAWSHAGGGGTTVFVGERVRLNSLLHLPLRVPVGQRRRGCAVLDAELDGVAFRAVSVHLGLQVVQRRRHATQLLDVVGAAPRTLLAGDANEPLDGPAVGILLGALRPLGELPPTYPSACPVHAIDLVLGSGVAGARELEVPVHEATLVAASDHRPRLLEIEL